MPLIFWGYKYASMLSVQYMNTVYVLFVILIRYFELPRV